MELLPEYDPRAFFAAERTLLAWIRTALALMGLGLVMARFEVLAPGRISAIAGAALISVSIVFLLASARIYVIVVGRLSRNEPFEGRPSFLILALTGTLVVLGVGAVAYLLQSG